MRTALVLVLLCSAFPSSAAPRPAAPERVAARPGSERTLAAPAAPERVADRPGRERSLVAPTLRQARVLAALEALKASGATAPDGTVLFPADLAVEELAELPAGLVLRASGSFDPLDPRRAEVVEELRREALLGALVAFEVEGGVELLLRRPGGTFLPYGVQPPQVTRLPGRVSRPGPRDPGLPTRATERLPLGGALVGRRIAISAGHGWLDDGAGGWRTQRSRWAFTGCGNCRGITEDFFTSEVVTNQLVPLLQGMGAEVVLVREPDHGRGPGTILDDGDAGYQESGGWEAGSNAGGVGGDYRTLAAGVAGEARFSDAASASGPRRVSVRWVEGANRSAAAVVQVAHEGGVSFLDLDQRRVGQLWLDIGSFWLGPASSVTLSGAADGYVIADAVKLGGGTHPTSAKPWWEMGAESYVPWAGAPADVTQYGDVSIRPAYAEYTDPDLYVSVHANASGVAGGSSAVGTSMYRYSCQSYSDHTSSESASGCDDPPGSKALLDSVHAAVLARLRADFDPNWADRRRLVANFGELRTLDDTPGILIETGFFDNQESPAGSPPPRYPDNRSLHDPRWREAFAYGVAEGIAAYLSPGAGAPPPRPEGLVARNQPDGTLNVSWRATPGAAGYRLYRATSGRAWDEGVFLAGTELSLADLEPRQVVALRVAAISSNGEGYPSQAVAARFRGAVEPGGPAAEALYVGAYDRRDAWVQDVDNDLSYAVEHGHALAAAEGDLFFDGALDEAVEDGTVALAPYRLVDLACGKDSSADDSISTAMMGLAGVYLAGGGAMLISGEEIGYDLVERSTDPADGAFLTEVLGGGYLRDDAETYSMSGVPGGPFDGVGQVAIDDGTGGVYEVVYPDVLAAGPGAWVAMTYPDGSAAAVAKPGVLLFGTPLEAVVPTPARAALFAKAVAFLVPDLGSGDLDLDGASDACEEAHRFDPRDGRDGAGDADGDGSSNAAECQAGTDPGMGGGGGAGGGGGGAGGAGGAGGTGGAGGADGAGGSGGDGGTGDGGTGGSLLGGGGTPPAAQLTEAEGGCDCSSGRAPGAGAITLALGLLAARLAGRRRAARP